MILDTKEYLMLERGKYLFSLRGAIQFSVLSPFHNPSSPMAIENVIIYIIMANTFVENIKHNFSWFFFVLPRVNEDYAE